MKKDTWENELEPLLIMFFIISPYTAIFFGPISIVLFVLIGFAICICSNLVDDVEENKSKPEVCE